MLYISTRNSLDTYTSYRALHEEFSPDGGYYVPFYLPSFSSDALNHFKKNTPSETISEILNLFFSLRLSATEIEAAIGKSVLNCVCLNQNLISAELWCTPDGSSDYLFKKLNYLMTGDLQLPVGWPRVAIEIALLFSLLSILPEGVKSFDVAITADDLSNVTALSFAKAMGFPLNLVICACDDNSAFWNLINKGEFSTANTPAYMELFLYKVAGEENVSVYSTAKENKRTYYVDESLMPILSKRFYTAVVSNDRADSNISGMYRSNQYMFDIGAALAFGGLQDYRAIEGVNKNTIIFVNKRPERIKE